MNCQRVLMFLVINLVVISCAHALLRDPTKPPLNIISPTAVTPTSFQLSAIIMGHGKPLAVINGEKKQVGDEILGEYVTAIYKNTVQLDGPSGKITLFLFGSPIKKISEIGCKRKWTVCMDAEV